MKTHQLTFKKGEKFSPSDLSKLSKDAGFKLLSECPFKFANPYFQIMNNNGDITFFQIEFEDGEKLLEAWIY